MVKDVTMRVGIFKLARYIGYKLPHIKEILLPVWRPFKNVCWISRNILTRKRPIKVIINQDKTMLLYPEGQIAKFMWGTEFELGERWFVASYLRPGMHVVNIGANIGLYTITASKLVGSSGKVQTFEPSSDTYRRLIRNINLNGCKNVQAHRVAISDEEGELVLRADPKNVELDAHRFVERTRIMEDDLLETDELVKCEVLDEYLSSIYDGTILPVDMMIVDVEGAELSVLRGGLRTLANSPNLVLMLECTRECAKVEELLSNSGFDFFRPDVAGRVLQPCKFQEAVINGNVIAIKSYADK